MPVKFIESNTLFDLEDKIGLAEDEGWVFKDMKIDSISEGDVWYVATLTRTQER